MKKYVIAKIALILSVLALSQCAPPTAQDRIDRNPAVFNAQPQAHQAYIQRGELVRGMSRDAVMLSWGRPSETAEGTEKGIPLERWIYLGTQTTFQNNVGFGFGGGWGGPWGGPFFDPFWGGPYNSFFLGPQTIQTPYQKATVLFIKNKVESWERLKSNR